MSQATACSPQPTPTRVAPSVDRESRRRAGCSAALREAEQSREARACGHQTLRLVASPGIAAGQSWRVVNAAAGTLHSDSRQRILILLNDEWLSFLLIDVTHTSFTSAEAVPSCRRSSSAADAPCTLHRSRARRPAPAAHPALNWKGCSHTRSTSHGSGSGHSTTLRTHGSGAASCSESAGVLGRRRLTPSAGCATGSGCGVRRCRCETRGSGHGALGDRPDLLETGLPP